MRINIVQEAFEPWQLLAQQTQVYGACNVFVGTMKDFNGGMEIQAMTLHYYPGMTEKQLEVIVNRAREQWSIRDSMVVHRVGQIQPNDAIVLVAVWADHRGDAFDACRFIMEQLKSHAPFWKQETLLTGENRWVECNTNGYAKT